MGIIACHPAFCIDDKDFSVIVYDGFVALEGSSADGFFPAEGDVSQAEVFDEEKRLCAEGLLEFFYLDKTVE